MKDEKYQIPRGMIFVFLSIAIVWAFILPKYLDKKGNIYVLDEPTTGLHASDVKKIMELLDSLVERGNTVIVIEHNLDVMKQADYIIDIGPDGGTEGGEVVFTGTPEEMIQRADTITAEYLRNSL